MDMSLVEENSEWRVKVAGSHSCVGVIRLTGLIIRLRLGPEVMGSLPIAQTVSPY